MKNNNTQSLFQNLTSNQVSDLIQEFKLAELGYKFFYFIDSYDLNLYSFPFGLVASESYDDRAKKSIEIVTDEQLSYDYLIRHSNDYLLLFDEYFLEYKDFKEKVKRAHYLGLDVVKSLKILIDHYDNYVNNNKISFEDLKQIENISEFQVSLLLAIVVGSMSEGIDKLNKLENNKLLFESSGFNIFSNEVNNLFYRSQPSSFTDELFSKLIKSYSRSTRIEPSRLIARYTDCKVYDRLLQLNKQQLNNKIGYFLMSSAVTSRRISQIAIENNYLPFLKNGKSINPIRTIEQLYLKLILEPSTNYIEDLYSIKQLIESKENYYESNVIFKPSIIEKIDKRISFLRESFENASLIMNFKNFSDSINLALKNEDLLKSDFVIPALKNLILLSDQKNIIENTRVKKLNELVFEKDYKNTLSLGIEDVNKNVRSFEICFGKDYITNSYHHLPLVYFFNNYRTYNDVINEIVKFLTEIEKKNRDSQSLINSINSTLSLLFEKAMPTYEENLIRLLILSLLRTIEDSRPEDLAFDRGVEILDSLADNKYRKEFLYFVSWMARRKPNYDAALKFAEEGIKIDNLDPRFYQSKALVNYCLYVDFKKEEFLKVAIENAKLSIEYYLILENPSIAIIKSIIALLNTNCYLLCLYYADFEKNKDYLYEARRNIELLKAKELNFEKIPEFMHTEAFLIKLEVESNFNNSESIKQLEYSIRIIKRAINLNSKENYIKLEKKLNYLLSEIRKGE